MSGEFTGERVRSPGAASREMVVYVVLDPFLPGRYAIARRPVTPREVVT